MSDIRPDGDGAELRLRELETLSPFLDLGGEFAALGLQKATEAGEALAALQMDRCERLLGQSIAYTEVANRITALAKSFA